MTDFFVFGGRARLFMEGRRPEGKELPYGWGYIRPGPEEHQSIFLVNTIIYRDEVAYQTLVVNFYERTPDPTTI